MNNNTVEELVKIIYNAIDDKLGQDIEIIRVGEVSSMCDYFVITSAPSQRQVKAICDSVEDALTEIGVEPRGKEGKDSQQWILLDYGDIMVHIFDEETRDFYGIEKLWKDAPLIDAATL